MVGIGEDGNNLSVDKHEKRKAFGYPSKEGRTENEAVRLRTHSEESSLRMATLAVTRLKPP